MTTQTSVLSDMEAILKVSSVAFLPSAEDPCSHPQDPQPRLLGPTGDRFSFGKAL